MNVSKHSLERRLLLFIAMVTFLYSFTSALVVFHFSYQREFFQLRSQQQQLVMALQPATAVAVFKENKDIANEVINSLMISEYTLGITLDSTHHFHVFYARPHSIKENDTIEVSFPLFLQQTPEETNGNITVTFDRKKIEQSALKVALFAALLALGQAILLALAIVVVARIVLFQPLSRLVNNVSALDAGQSSRLDIPDQNHHDEIGLIGTSINKMLASIDDAMCQITRQKDTALQATASKSRFLAAASHDLRQPMHALNMYLGLLQNYFLSPEALTLLGKARQCGQSMDEMFLAFLDISKLDASVIKPNREVFPLQEIIDQVLLEFQPIARDKGIVLSHVRTKSWIFSDANFVKNILRNLMSNALRYTSAGKIVVGCRRKNGAIMLSVLDTGCGIADIYKDQIFNDFYQISATEKPHNTEQGIGLGLAITQRLATLLETKIEMSSELGRGSRFCIRLPSASPLVEAQPCKATSTQLDHPANPKGLLILVIDDDEIILDSTYSLLSKSGFATIVATSAEQAVAHLMVANRVPDLILCDYQLAFNQTGYQAIEMIREEFASNIPALIITGDTAPDLPSDLEVSEIRVLHKPMQVEALLEEIINTISKARIDCPDPGDAKCHTI